ncbi:hypothetical protein N9395_06650 [Pseudomonadales bacterium]|nr:hypothetical protein [Pseudomonadales bacterium]
MKKKKILFVCYGGGHAAMLVPILKELIERNECNLIVLALTTSYDFLVGCGIDCVRFKDYAHLSVGDDWLHYGNRLVGSRENYSGLVSYEESVAYHGINYTDLIAQMGLEDAGKKYNSESRHAFYPINFMLRLLEEVAPDLVFATNSPRSERAAIDAANGLCIKSICLVDLFASEEYKWIANDNFATKVLVLDHSVKEFLVGKGRHEDHIEITGNPNFDSMFLEETLEIASKLKGERYNGEKINILYASQAEPQIHPFNGKVGDINLPMINERMLREFVKENDGFRLVVRYHPSQSITFESAENVLLSTVDENLHGLLHCMDIIVVSSSTVGVEAHLIGKQVISIDTSIFTDDSNLSGRGISRGVISKNQLFNSIVELSRLLSKGEVEIKKSQPAGPKICGVIDKLLLDH